eukprot:2214975-Pleurochrysis_carterae.AAC.1
MPQAWVCRKRGCVAGVCGHGLLLVVLLKPAELRRRPLLLPPQRLKLALARLSPNSADRVVMRARVFCGRLMSG